MTKIVGIVGSLRKKSFNRYLLEAAKGLMPQGSSLDILSIADVPLYNGDVEAEGVPKSVTELADAIVAADGLLVSSPEYNAGIPGVVKNAIDWLSRPPHGQRVFSSRPVGVIGATPGLGGTRLAQNAWLSVFRLVGAQFFVNKSVYVSGVNKVFADDGALTDDKVREVLSGYLEAFVKFASAK
ncbi:MAG: NADPH-dependent FMN reductase [Polyangiaceae bacterium]